MRLAPAVVSTLVDEARNVFGADVDVWLFGSRVDDNARGGDIDLYIETEDDGRLLDHRLDYLLRLSRILGERKIDLVIRPRTRPLSPIHRIARKTGIKLTSCLSPEETKPAKGVP